MNLNELYDQSGYCFLKNVFHCVKIDVSVRIKLKKGKKNWTSIHFLYSCIVIKRQNEQLYNFKSQRSMGICENNVIMLKIKINWINPSLQKFNQS